MNIQYFKNIKKVSKNKYLIFSHLTVNTNKTLSKKLDELIKKGKDIAQKYKDKTRLWDKDAYQNFKFYFSFDADIKNKKINGINLQAIKSHTY